MNDNIKFQVEDITSKMSVGTQLLLKTRINSAIREYLEERPCAPDLKAKTTRFIKKLLLRIVYKILYRHPYPYIQHLLAIRYGIAGSLFTKAISIVEAWKEEIFLHCIAPCFYVGVTAKESELDKGYLKLSSIIEYDLGPDVIKGSISGAMKIALYRMPDHKEQEYALVAYVHTTRGYSELVNKLLQLPEGRKFVKARKIFGEGAKPEYWND